MACGRGGIHVGSVRLDAGARPKAWDIWLADVDFGDMAGHKKRPVLVISAKGASFTVLEITSQGQRVITDIDIVDLVGAGLEKPSVIRVDRKRDIARDRFVHLTGRLPSEYRNTVKKGLEFRRDMESYD
jgi:mRNA-degrading endonuclease toxin of MazEF toxin-antitoxin module